MFYVNGYMEPNCTWRGKGVTSQARGMAVAWKTGITQMGMISYLQKKSVKEQRNRKLENLTHSSWGAETTFETTRNPKGFWWCKDNLFMYLSSLLDSFRGATASLRFWFPGSAWHMKGIQINVGKRKGSLISWKHYACAITWKVLDE